MGGMWLATKHGFYSIVKKQSGQFHVRARVRRDLVNLVRLLEENFEILEWPSADYRYRILVDQRDLGAIMAALALSLDYPNFKSQIARTRDQQPKLAAFHEVWAILAGLSDDSRP